MSLRSDFFWTLARPGLLCENFYPDQLVSDQRCLALAEKLREFPIRVDSQSRLAGLPRLGRYSERLLEILIKELISPENFAANLPVREGKNTLGEFDFVFRQGEVTEHWEAAIKFYLAVPPDQGLLSTRSFVGPSLRDRMDLKLTKIFDHQLALAHRPVGANVLAENGFEVPISRAFIKGMLFYPKSDPRTIAQNWSLPPEISPRHARGWWAMVRELESFSEGTFVVLPRLSWISEFRIETGLPPDSQMDLRQLIRFCDSSPDPVCVAELEREGDGWVEKSRGFVVANDWKSRAKLYSE